MERSVFRRTQDRTHSRTMSGIPPQWEFRLQSMPRQFRCKGQGSYPGLKASYLKRTSSLEMTPQAHPTGSWQGTCRSQQSLHLERPKVRLPHQAFIIPPNLGPFLSHAFLTLLTFQLSSDCQGNSEEVNYTSNPHAEGERFVNPLPMASMITILDGWFFSHSSSSF